MMLRLTSVSWTSVGSFRSSISNSGCVQFVCSKWQLNLARSMTTKSFRVKKEKPPPFPYEKGTFNTFWQMFEVITDRYDENTKLVIVEGPVHSGKHEVAKQIAEAFELKYQPNITMDKRYINYYGYDLRNLNPALPESLQSFDEKDYNLNPTHFNVAAFQLTMYRLRMGFYIDYLAHIMNTGEGVVAVRSPFSDFIWAETMFQHGHLSPPAKRFYYQVLRHSLYQLYRPHLIIYLDVPVEKTIENIKTKGHDYEINSKALTPEYLQTMETMYKERYLPEASVAAEVLIVDGSEELDIEDIIEDIERIDFEQTRNDRDPKFSDWRDPEFFQDQQRLNYTQPDLRDRLLNQMNICCYDVPELFADVQEWEVYDAVVSKAPGMEYAPGFNFKRGEKNIMWKSRKTRYYDHVGED